MEFRLGKNENGRRRSPDLQIGATRCVDGVTLRTFDSAPDESTGSSRPVIVLLNGLGGPFQVWRPLVQALGPAYRLLSWDYRGLYGSTVPSSGQAGAVALDVATHAEDLGRVLTSAEVSRAHLVAWSMGVQVALQATAQLPRERIASLTLMNGTFGRPLRALGLPRSAGLTSALMRSSRWLEGRGLPFAERLAKSPLALGMLQRLRIVAPGVPQEYLKSMVTEFRDLDPWFYTRLLHELSVHDAAPLLCKVHCPTLVITGSRDPLIPAAFSRRIADEIPGAVRFVLAGGSHYAPLEAPDEVAARIHGFIQAQHERPGLLPSDAPC